MKSFCTILAATLLVPAAALAQALPDNPAPAQTDHSDWNRVASLARGDKIVVHIGHGFPLRCSFDGATQEGLACEWDSLLVGKRDYQFSRSEISTVRLDQSERNRWIIIGVATAAGIVAGAAANPKDTGTPREISTVEVGAVGAATGWFISAIATPFIPGRLIYRRLPDRLSPSSSVPSSIVAKPQWRQP